MGEGEGNKMNCYSNAPLATIRMGEKDVPVFSTSDSYVKNYEKIAGDHFSCSSGDQSNPFVAESFLDQSDELSHATLKKYLKPGHKILDVGCGSGRLLSLLSDFERFGMDISETYLRSLITEEINLCLAMAEDMPYHRNYFDVVVCTDVLEHVKDLNLVLGNIFSVLKPGGLLLIRVPYKENLHLYTEDNYPYEFAHLRNFDENGMRLLVEKVFMGKMLEVQFGPYLCEPTYFKIPVVFKGGSFLSRQVSKILRVLPVKTRHRLENLILEPVEMHLVFEKLRD